MMVSASEALRDAMTALAGRVEQSFTDWSHAPDHLQIRGVRLEQSMPGLDPMAWLLGQQVHEQIFWSARDQEDVVAGIGICHVLGEQSVEHPESLFAQGQRVLAAFGELAPRYFGGFAFSSGAVEEMPWHRMGRSRFWIPRVEICLRDGHCVLACNLLFQRNVDESFEKVMREIGDSVLDAYRPPPLPTIIGRRDHPDRAGWEANVHAALDMIDSALLDKLVLARKAVYMFSDPVEAVNILAILKGVTSSCYHFLFQPEAGLAFMGTPPECLYRRKERDVSSEALAGTRARTGEHEEDQRLSDELLQNEKERREQEYVRSDLLRTLHLLCDELEADAHPVVLQLERKQHLLSRLRGTLKTGIDDATLIQSLHPTPAVGGTPRENALREIPRLEPFCRGWYAAPVGWFGREGADFAVAIRSGLVIGRRVNIYSGAGIVAGSDPASEWEEIEQKISDFVTVTRGRHH